MDAAMQYEACESVRAYRIVVFSRQCEGSVKARMLKGALIAVAPVRRLALLRVFCDGARQARGFG